VTLETDLCPITATMTKIQDDTQWTDMTPIGRSKTCSALARERYAVQVLCVFHKKDAE